MRKLHSSYIAWAIQYARERWALDDPAIVREWVFASWQHYERASELVDAYARKYDLTDPRDL